MLPKTLYEILPYSYLMVGAALLLYTPSALMLFASLALFIAGASIWVRRSKERSRDARHLPIDAYIDQHHSDLPFDHYRRIKRVPGSVYEYLPFGYLLLAIWCYRYQAAAGESLYIWMSISLLALAGLISWGMRAYFRGYHRYQPHSEPLIG